MREAETGLYFVSIGGIMLANAQGRVNTNFGSRLRGQLMINNRGRG